MLWDLGLLTLAIALFAGAKVVPPADRLGADGWGLPAGCAVAGGVLISGVRAANLRALPLQLQPRLAELEKLRQDLSFFSTS